MRPLFVSMLALWLVMSPAHAWHETGHKLTAEIAFNLLSPKQQQHVAAVLRAHPRFKEDFANAMPEAIASGSETEKALWIFKHASIWSDLVPDINEAVRTRYHRGTWHYVNLPVYLTEQDEKELAGKLDHNMSPSFDPPLRQNLNVIQALQGNLLDWRDEGASDADKAVALCWILHLTGDMHQPLHNVALFSRSYFPKGDRGGNDINVAWEDDTRNLHAVWDGFPTRIENIVPRVAATVQLGSDTVSMQSIEVWAEQHAKIAKQYVYTKSVKEQLLSGFAANTNPDIRLTADYLTSGRTIASAQVILAGRRIAALLEN